MADTIQVTLVPAAPGPDPNMGFWIGLAIGAFLLLAVSLLAHRRLTRPDQAPPARLSRILWSSLTCSGGLTLMLLPDQTMSSSPFDPPLDLALFASFAGLTLLVLMLLGTADLLLDLFRPRRTLIWLCIAPVILTAFIAGMLATTDWLDPESSSSDSTRLLLIVALVGSAVTWWSWLPAPNRQVARIFE